MTSVSVISSVHKARGKADAAALLAILQDLQPAVLFLEQPETGFEDFCSGVRPGLESRAACRYHQSRGAMLVPVDLTMTPPFTRSEIDDLYEAIGRQSPHFLQLESIRERHTDDFGFAFLNSQTYFNLSTAITTAEESAIEAIGSESLSLLYRQWRGINKLREQGMMANVETYARNNSFDHGAFLIGAAHIVSVHAMSRDRPLAASSVFQWEFLDLGTIGGTAPQPP